MLNSLIVSIFTFTGISVLAGDILLKHDFNVWTEGWTSPEYWGGEIELGKSIGRNDSSSLHLVVGPDKMGKVYCQAACFPDSPALPGRRMRMTGYAKGHGKFTAWLTINIVPNIDGITVAAPCTPAELTLNADEWQLFTFEMDLEGVPGNKATPMIAIPEDGDAYVDDLLVEFLTAPDAPEAVTASVKSVDVPAAGELPRIEFSTGRPGDIVTVLQMDCRGWVLHKEKCLTDSRGICEFYPARSLPSGQCKAIASCGGRNVAVTMGVAPW